MEVDGRLISVDVAMVVTLIIIVIGLLPALFSLLLLRKAELQARERLRSAMSLSANSQWRQFYAYSLAPDHHYVEGIGYMSGDLTCRYNARSPHLRCAVNPAGPCEGCRCYESIEFKD